MSAQLPPLETLAAGAWLDVPAEAYHTGPGVSKSQLAAFSRTPAHARHALDHWAAELHQYTPATLLGSLTHMLILEPENVGDRFVVERAFSGKGAVAARAEWRDFTETAGLASVPQDTWDRAVACASAVRREWGHLLEDGEVEHSAYWTDANTGMLCRCRPDFVTAHQFEDEFENAHRVVLDVKTAEDAGYSAFGRSIARFGYHTSVAMYRQGMERVHDEPFHYWFLVVESKPPHLAALYAVDMQAEAIGLELFRRQLGAYVDARRSGRWPGYPRAVRVVELPKWAANQPYTEIT